MIFDHPLLPAMRFLAMMGWPRPAGAEPLVLDGCPMLAWVLIMVWAGWPRLSGRGARAVLPGWRATGGRAVRRDVRRWPKNLFQAAANSPHG